LNAAKKIILLLWLVIVASLGNVSALTPGATENRVWQKSFAVLESRQAEPLQTPGLHQENESCGYELAPESLLAAKTVGGFADEAVTLTQQQASNLARFNKKLPAGNTGTAVDTLGDGVLFTSKVPGRVPGSSAVYQKSVDAAGNTSSYLKTTFDPKGNIIHIKDKLNGGVIPHQ